MEMNETAVRRIQKLLAIANDKAASESEAETAMQMAQDILAKYNLDMAVVKDAVVEGGTVKQDRKRAKQSINRSAMYEWQRELWKVIAESNFCMHWITTEFPKGSKKGVKRHVVLGDEVNVVSVQIMGEYLCDTIERLLPEKNNAKRLSREMISWRAGCAARLMQRLIDQYTVRQRESEQARKDNSVTSTAITVRSVIDSEYRANYDYKYGVGAYDRAIARNKEAEAKSKEYWDDLLAKETPAQKRAREEKERKQAERWRKQAETQSRQQSRRYDWDAFDQGSEAGRSIGLDPQIKNNSNRGSL